MPSIILIYDFDDDGMRKVRHSLELRTDCKTLLLRDPANPIEVWHDGSRLLLSQSGTRITDTDFRDTPLVVFHRCRMYDDPFVELPVLGDSDRAFAEREWTSLLFGILLQQEFASTGLWVNAPSLHYVHRNKYALVCRAQAHGLDVPSFLSSTRLERPAGERLDVVAKAISTDQHIDQERYFFTTPLTPEFLDSNIGAASPCPTFLQERVPHSKEWRVYYLFGECLAFELSTRVPVPDIRMSASSDLIVAPVQIPAALVGDLTNYCHEVHLHYCTFDFLIEGARPRLVDVTPFGSWDYIDDLCTESVSEWITTKLQSVAASAA